MTMLAIITLAVLSIAALYALSMIAGHRRTSRPHLIAFYAGLTGFVALLAFLVSFAEIATRIPYITLEGPLGVLFVGSAALLFGAACMCGLALLSIHQDRRRAI